MQRIPLEVQPSQEFSLVLNNLTYRIRVADVTNGLMVVDVKINTEAVVNGVRALHADFVLPWPTLERNNGNFMWFDDQGRQPHWENFGATCRLYYVSAAEMDAMYRSSVLSEQSGVIIVPSKPRPRRLRANGEFRADGSQKANGWVTE
jgi:hypothetical protein